MDQRADAHAWSEPAGDVWEVIAAVEDNDGDVAASADYLALPLGLVQAAVTYYGAFPDEVDSWIARKSGNRSSARSVACRPGRAPAVKLLLDEMLSPVIAQQLRDLGHDVESVAGHPAREALSDVEVMALARAERRAVVTNNSVDSVPSTTRPVCRAVPGISAWSSCLGTTVAPKATSDASSRRWPPSWLSTRARQTSPTAKPGCSKNDAAWAYGISVTPSHRA